MNTTQTAIASVHTHTMADGTVVKTTWHDTRAQAKSRANSEPGAHVRSVHTGGFLGNFRAVTWHK